MVFYEDSFRVGEALACTKMEIDEECFVSLEIRELENLDEFLSDIPDIPEPVDIDGQVSGTVVIPEPMKTDEHFVENADIQELVNIHDDFSRTLETPERMAIDYSV